MGSKTTDESRVTAPTLLDPKRTWLPLGVVLGIAVLTVSVIWQIAQWTSAITANTDAVLELKTVIKSTWTRSDMERWVETMRLLNPEIKIPSAR